MATKKSQQIETIIQEQPNPDLDIAEDQRALLALLAEEPLPLLENGELPHNLLGNIVEINQDLDIGENDEDEQDEDEQDEDEDAQDEDEDEQDEDEDAQDEDEMQQVLLEEPPHDPLRGAIERLEAMQAPLQARLQGGALDLNAARQMRQDFFNAMQNFIHHEEQRRQAMGLNNDEGQQGMDVPLVAEVAVQQQQPRMALPDPAAFFAPANHNTTPTRATPAAPEKNSRIRRLADIETMEDGNAPDDEILSAAQHAKKKRKHSAKKLSLLFPDSSDSDKKDDKHDDTPPPPPPPPHPFNIIAAF